MNARHDSMRDLARLSRPSRRSKSLLRFLTCGSVDDGKSTLIGRLLYDSKLLFEDQLAALEKDSQEARHHRRRYRFRAAGRRPGGRARAGHHHRRRLSLLRHRQAQIHRRRHARPRAVHPQHGDRRLELRPRRHPDRCAQGRADADAAPRLHRLAARHPPRRAGGQQDRPGRISRRRCSSTSSRTSRPSRSDLGFTTHAADPDVGALRRQRHRDEREHALVRGPVAPRPSRNRRCRDGAGRRSRSACRCNG